MRSQFPEPKPRLLGIVLAAFCIGIISTDMRMVILGAGLISVCSLVLVRAKAGWAVWLLPLFLVIFAMPRRYSDIALALGPISFVDMTMCLTLFALVLENFRHQQLAYWLPVMLVAAIAMVRVLIDGTHAAEELMGLIDFVLPIGIGMQVKLALEYKGGLAKVNAALLVTALTTCALALWGYWQGDGLIQLGSTDIKHQSVGIIRAISPLGNTNTLGATMALLIPLPLSFFMFETRRRLRLLGLSTAVTFAVVLILTGSRAGLLGGLAGVAFLLFRARRFIRPSHWLLIAVAFASVAGGVFFFGGQLVRAQSLLTEGLLGVFESSGRKDTWAQGLGLLLQQPLTGWGPLNITHAFHAHNLYIELLAENGIVVGGYMLSILVWQVFTHRRAVTPYAVGTSAGLAAFLVAGMGDYLLWEPRVGVVVWVVVAMLGASNRHIPTAVHPSHSAAVAATPTGSGRAAMS